MIELLGNKTTEANLDITENGIDMAHSDGVEFLWVTLPKNEFIAYEFTENISFCINTKTFGAVIKKLENENIRLDISNSQIKMFIQQDRKKKEYNLRVMDEIEDKSNSIKHIKTQLISGKEETFGDACILNPKEIQNMISDLVLDLENVTIQIVNNNLIIREEEATRGNNKSQLTLLGALNLIDKSARYNKKRLLSVIEPIAKTFDKVQVRFKDDTPILIKIDENMKMYYFLAPIVENI